MTNTITLSGNLGRDAELKYTNNGSPVLELNIADTPRRKNADTGQWEDAGNTVWFRASVWGGLGEAIANANIATKGATVDVTGTLSVREYEKDGQTRTSHEVRVNTIGIREKRGAGNNAPRPAASAAPADPWGAPAPAQATFPDEPPF